MSRTDHRPTLTSVAPQFLVLDLDAACAFYRDHQQPDAAHELAQYVSLALVMGPPPGFELKMKEADLPPDAGFVVGVGAPLQVFYQRAGLHALWEKHQTEYQALLDQYHEQIVRQIQSPDSYLRLPIGSYHARRMAMLLEGKFVRQGSFEEVFTTEDERIKSFYEYNFIQ